MTISISLQPYTHDCLLSFVNHLVDILPRYGLTEIDLSFGFAWGNDVHDWKTRTVSLASLKPEINEAEQKGFGSLGHDDLYIFIKSHDLEIHLCHEEDIHVKFTKHTDLIDDLINYLISSFKNVVVEKRHRKTRVYPYDLPAFLYEEEISNTTDKSQLITIDPWQKTFECSPNSKMKVVGYSSMPGFLTLDSTGDQILIKGWPSSNIRIFENDNMIFDTKDDSILQ